MKYVLIALTIVAVGLIWGLFPAVSETNDFDLSGYAKRPTEGIDMNDATTHETATIGGGCFWCVEAVFERIDGVKSAVSGYAGGNKANPTYDEVTSGRTGHAEVVQVTFDPAKITYDEILEIFLKSHDPTTLNRQGADVGTHYRSVILYHDESQREAALEVIERIGELYVDRIVTELEPLQTFYPAEEYHQDYFAKNPFAGYCRVVIAPKLQKLGLDEVGTF